MLAAGDIVLALSYSGETEELLRLLPTLKRLKTKLIAISGCATSTLAQASDIFLDTSVSAEACPLNLAPTASTTVMLALGDALALEVSRRRGWKAEDFADLHPGGRIGRRLARVRELMHTGDALPQVAGSTPMPQVIYEMSRKKLGMTTVLDRWPSRRHDLGRRSPPPARTRWLPRARTHRRRDHESAAPHDRRQRFGVYPPSL